MSDETGKSGPTLREKLELKRVQLLKQLAGVAACVQGVEQELAKLAEVEQFARDHDFDLVPRLVDNQRETSGSPAISAPVPDTPLRKNEKAVPGFTIADLLESYLTDPRSSYQKVHFKTRRNYKFMYDRIKRERGQIHLSKIFKADLEGFYNEWSAGGVKTAVGISMMGKLRTLFSYGATVLENEKCQQLCGIYRQIHLKVPRVRVERLTASQVNAICAVAREQNRSSIAVAQAIQFATDFRQGDVIGEYVPLSEPGISDVINPKLGQKWVGGLRWEEIDSNMVLTHEASARQKVITIDLKTVPLVIKELGTADKI